MEKAFAKFHGNYARIVGGDSVDGISTLNGSPHDRIWHDEETVNTVWQFIKDYMPIKGLLTAGTPCSSGDDTTVNDQGLVNCHAYPVLDFHTLSRNSQRLVKMRNPWSVERYYGPWSDFHTNATYQLTTDDLIELDHEQRNDGVFWMAIEDYTAFTHYTTLNYDVDQHSWHHAWHLTVDDDRTGGVDGQWSWCGSSCTRYYGVIKNTSSVSNKIHPGIHMWRWRSYAETPKSD